MTRVLTLLCISIALAASPAMASKHKKSKARISGIHCFQGPDSVKFPLTIFKPHERKKLYKGQKGRFNLAGYGPVNCVIY